MNNNQTLNEKKGKGTEVEVLYKRNGKDAREEEVRAPDKRSTPDHQESDNETTNQGQLKTYLRHIVRVQGPGIVNKLYEIIKICIRLTMSGKEEKQPR